MALQLCLEGVVVEGWVKGCAGPSGPRQASEGPYQENDLIYLILLVRVFPREGPPFQLEGLLGGGFRAELPTCLAGPLTSSGRQPASGRRAGLRLGALAGVAGPHT